LTGGAGFDTGFVAGLDGVVGFGFDVGFVAGRSSNSFLHFRQRSFRPTGMLPRPVMTVEHARQTTR
jgi:hypothetical protein